MTLRPVFALGVLALAACTDRELRGRSALSKDGRTYLAIADDNGGRCGQIRVDGAPWPHPIGEAGAVTPGDHRIACGSAAAIAVDSGIAIHVDSGRTFRFDYWGP